MTTFNAGCFYDNVHKNDVVSLKTTLFTKYYFHVTFFYNLT